MLNRKPFSGVGISFKFLMFSAAAIMTIFAVLLTWFWNLQTEHIMEQVRKQAIILYKQIIMTRHWCSENNGILVEKSDHLDSNPYLKEPDVVGKNEIVYTRITPSILTTLLSEKAKGTDLYWFKLTNDVYLNPQNAPDSLESKALKIFRDNPDEVIYETDFINGKPTLRYLAPVFVTSDCVQCHSDQTSRVGNIGGCLSVFIPMDAAQSAIWKNTLLVFGGGMGMAVCLVGLLYLISSSLVFNRINEIRKAINTMDVNNGNPESKSQGDELKEISDFCYLLDRKLRSEHDELENRIREATRDLSVTKDRLEKANKELEALNKAKTDFFSDISHELRTPLTAIKGAADIMSRTSKPESPQYLDIIKRNTEHLTKLVVDFLDFSKIEDGQIELDLGEHSIRDVVESAMKSLESEASRKSVSMECKLDDTRFRFDSTRIFQVITNLLSNAIRFSPDHGRIKIVAQIQENGFIRIHVEDDGPGVPQKYQKNIFKKFYRIKDSGDQAFQKGSSGIGLAICQGLVEAHGGRIWVENAAGGGAKFVFELPMGCLV